MSIFSKTKTFFKEKPVRIIIALCVANSYASGTIKIRGDMYTDYNKQNKLFFKFHNNFYYHM